MWGLTMNKENIIHLANNLYEETFWANSYWNLLQQIQDQLGNYYEEINVSPCFYNLIHNALLKGMLMEIAKLYDTNGLSLHGLLDEINPERADQDVIRVLNEIPIRHQVTEYDCVHFIQEVEQYWAICDSLNKEHSYPIVELSYQAYFNYLTKQICTINKSIVNLREQRNKLLAHNGVEYNFDYKTINKKFPLVKSDVDKLMEYAFELTTLIIEKFTGVSKSHTSIDIDDWERTIELVREGQRVINEEYIQCENDMNFK
jgi:hypothetical protein